MKKFYFLVMGLIISQGLCFADIKDSSYMLRDVAPDMALAEIGKNLTKLNIGKPTIDVTQDVIYSKGATVYYLKFYPSNKNTDLFVASEKEDQNTILQAIKETGYKNYLIEDKDLTKKYRKEFNEYVNQNRITVETIGKVEKQVKSYKEYSPLNNMRLEETAVTDGDIKIVRVKYETKVGVQHYASGYEYVVTNNGSTPIVLKNIISDNFMSLIDIAKKVAVSAGGAEWIPIYGMVYAIQTDVEKNKFTRPLPKNETLAPNQTIRMLTLVDLRVRPEANFTFLINDKEHKIKF